MVNYVRDGVPCETDLCGSGLQPWPFYCSTETN